jgi:hypothetical protein
MNGREGSGLRAVLNYGAGDDRHMLPHGRG